MVHLTPPRTWINGNAMVFHPRPASAVGQPFLYLLAQHIDFGPYISGTATPQITRKAIANIAIALPPLEEQERIVRTTQDLLWRLEVTERSLELARARSESLRRALATHLGRTDGPMVRLEDLSTHFRNGIFVSRPASEPPGTPIFRISAVRPLVLDPADIRYADKSDSEVHDYFVEPGDLLFTRYSGNPRYVGSCAVVEELPQRTLHPDKLIRVAVDQERADPWYVAVALNFGAGRAQIDQRLRTTAGQVGISGSSLKQVSIPVPPVDQQRKLVARLRDQLDLIQRLTDQVAAADRRRAALRSSILAAAFAGRLTAQEAVSV